MGSKVNFHEAVVRQLGDSLNAGAVDRSQGNDERVQVRDAVFETNSSSSHSLTMASGDKLSATFPQDMLRSGRVPVRMGEFGWEWHRYFEPLNKVRYLVTQITDGQPPEVAEGVEVSAQLAADNPHFRLLAEVVKTQSGCDLVVERTGGNIDHQSARGEKAVGMELFGSADRLRNFIFSPDSYLETGNDNSPAGWTMATDRGPQLTYMNRFSEPGPDWVGVKFIRLDAGRDDLATTAGGVVTQEVCQALWADVARSAVVMSVDWVIRDRYSPERAYSMDETRGKAAYELQMGRKAMRLSPNFRVDLDLRNSKERMEEFSFVCMVPADLAARLSRLSRLDSKGHRQYLVKQGEQWVGYWKKRLMTRPKDRWALERLAEEQGKLQKLIGAGALEAWMKKAKAGRGKDSYTRSSKNSWELAAPKLVKRARKRAGAAKGASK